MAHFWGSGGGSALSSTFSISVFEGWAGQTLPLAMEGSQMCQKWMEGLVIALHSADSVVQCSRVHCSAVQCSSVQCSAVQYSAVQYIITITHKTLKRWR